MSTAVVPLALSCEHVGIEYNTLVAMLCSGSIQCHEYLPVDMNDLDSLAEANSFA
jgi:hypothetical protein